MFIIILFAIFFLLVIYYDRKDVKRNNYVNFLSKTELQKFIQEDKDYYITLLSNIDLYARNEETHEGYKMKCINDVTETKEKSKFNVYCQEVDQWFKNRTLKYIGNNHKIDEIKWNIGFTKGYYEGGYPHTRGRIIFLPIDLEMKDAIQIKSILVHEKIHIYQRYNREKVVFELEKYGYKRDVHKSKEYLMRANPDTDEFLYTNPINERMMFKYWNDKPVDIQDGIINGKFEHPFEMISYEIENDFLNDVKIKKNE